VRAAVTSPRAGRAGAATGVNACAAPPPSAADPRPNAASNTRTAFSLLPDPAYSLGAFYSMEAVYPSLCRRMAAVLRRHGLAGPQLHYWELHDEGDEAHSAEWLVGIERARLGDEAHARIANGAITHLLVRSRLFTAIAGRVAALGPSPRG